MKYLYIIKCNDYLKVGMSKDVSKRLVELQIANPYELEIVDTYAAQKPNVAEHMAHKALAKYHVRGEWFDCDIETARDVLKKMASDDSLEFRVKDKVKPKVQHHKGDVVIDEAILAGILTKGCGLPKWKAQLMGLSFPPKRGWKKKVLGRRISQDTKMKLMEDKYRELNVPI